MKNNKSHKASHETWQLTLWPWSFTVQYIYSTSWITNCGTSMFVKKKQPIWIFIIMIIWGRQCIYKALWKEGRSRSHTYIHKVNSHFFFVILPTPFTTFFCFVLFKFCLYKYCTAKTRFFFITLYNNYTFLQRIFIRLSFFLSDLNILRSRTPEYTLLLSITHSRSCYGEYYS